MEREELLQKIRDKIAASQKTLIYFDDDVDGLASYNLIHRLTKKHKGVIIKSTPVLRSDYIRAMESYEPDLLIVLDKPMIEEDFIQQVDVPMIWIDHHDTQSNVVARFKSSKDILYFNPHNYNNDDNSCTSFCCYQIAKENEWLCTLGSVADWQLNDVTQQFAKKNPKILDPKVKNPAEALFAQPIGRYVKLLTFNLKGQMADVKKSIFAFSRIDSLEQLDDLSNDDASFLAQRYNEVASEYDSLLQTAKAKAAKAKRLLLFEYDPKLVSVTSELSNELLFNYPEKVICIARLKGEEYKCSLRSSLDLHLPTYVQTALEGLKGYGGGHEHACGACVHKDDFNLFITRFEKMLPELSK